MNIKNKLVFWLLFSTYSYSSKKLSDVCNHSDANAAFNKKWTDNLKVLSWGYLVIDSLIHYKSASVLSVSATENAVAVHVCYGSDTVLYRQLHFGIKKARCFKSSGENK